MLHNLNQREPATFRKKMISNTPVRQPEGSVAIRDVPAGQVPAQKKGIEPKNLLPW